jgi:hypothetical protein
MITKHILLAAKIALPVCLALPLVVLSGCSTTSSSRAEGAAVTALALSAEYQTLGGEIAVSVQLLDEVTAASAFERSKAYDRFHSQLKQLEAHGQRVSRASANMQKRSHVYTEAWQAQIDEVQNPKIRAVAEQRSAKVREQFESVREELNEVQETYSEFERNLLDISIVLEADLSGPGVQLLETVIETASDDSVTAREEIQHVVGQLDWISNALAKPVAPPSEDDTEQALESELTPAEPEISDVFETPEETTEAELPSEPTEATETSETGEPTSTEEPTDQDS